MISQDGTVGQQYFNYLKLLGSNNLTIYIFKNIVDIYNPVQFVHYRLKQQYQDQTVKASLYRDWQLFPSTVIITRHIVTLWQVKATDALSAPGSGIDYNH